MVRRTLCGPTACWILAQTSSLVTWSLCKMCSILRYHLISMACIFLWSPVVRVHDSLAYRKTDVTREHMRLSWNWKKYSCQFKLVSSLSVLLSSGLSWRVSKAWNPHQLCQGTWSLWLSQASVHSLWSLCWCHWCCHQLGLLGTDLHAVGCGGFVETLH